jgi:hypothetical protein
MGSLWCLWKVITYLSLSICLSILSSLFNRHLWFTFGLYTDLVRPRPHEEGVQGLRRAVRHSHRRGRQVDAVLRGLDGEAGPDVTPGDRGDVPQDGWHHQEVPYRDELSWQPGSTTVSTVPPVVLQLRLDWSFPRGNVVLVTATLPGSFVPGVPSGATSL